MPESSAIRAGIRSAAGWRRAIGWLVGLFRAGGMRPQRQLRLCETLALGEKRFLAVIEFERQKLLVGGTSNSLVMLAALPARDCAAANNEDGSGNGERNRWKV